MPVLLHRSHRLENLADLLARLLQARPPPDPITPQTIVVGSRGMERWLRAHLAQAHGICANVEFIFPARAINRLIDPLVGPRPDPDPWAPEPLGWTLLDLLPDLADHPDLGPVRRWLKGDEEPVSRRRYGLTRELADVLDRYHLARPSLIQDFAAKQPPSSETEAWQGALWRACRSRTGEPCPTERAAQAASALRSGSRPDLHDLYLFGISALPPLWLDLLDAASAQLTLHLLLFSPSEQWWGDFITPAEARRTARKGLQGAELAHAAMGTQHPLLTSLGRLSRDMQGLLAEHLSSAAEPAAEPLRIDPPTTCALHHLQHDLRSLQLPEHPRELDPSDRSIQLHACAGPARQAHALRDALLHLFNTDSTLQPRDVVVLTPDIDTFGPLIQGSLEQGGFSSSDPAWREAGGPRLPCAVSDSRLRAANLCAQALLSLLELAESRVTAPALFSLARLDPVARRFRFSPDDLGVIRTWLQGAGFRWGLDAQDRARHDQPADLQNTLRFALRRLALGVVVADEGQLLPAGTDPWVSPFDDLEGHNVALFGRFAHFADTVESHLRTLRGPRPVPGHLDRIRQAFSELVEPDPQNRSPYEQVLEALEGVRAQASAFDRPVQLAAIRHLMSGHFEQTRHDDRPITGAVTVSALTPMRSVPFRVVCLVGLDEGSFPRQASRPGWDLVALHPKPGDRDPRDEDRHLLLESIFAARDHLVITCTARDAQRGDEVPFSPPIAELIGALDQTFTTASGAPAQTRMVYHHPLQPTAQLTFQGSSPSFDARAARLLGALHGPRSPVRAFPSAAALPVDTSSSVPLHELITALIHPQRALCRAMRLRTTAQTTSPADREPLSVSGLERWSILYEGLSDPAQGPPSDLAPFARQLRAQGRVQPGRAGDRQSRDLYGVLRELCAAREHYLQPARTLTIDLELPSGRRLHGELRALGPSGPVITSPSAPDRPRSILTAWVSLLALAVHEPQAWATVIGTRSGRLTAARLTAPAEPLAILSDLVELFDTLRARPALLLPNLSQALVSTMYREDPDLDPNQISVEQWEPALRAVATGAWGTPYQPGADRADPYVQLILGDEPPFLTTSGRLEPTLVQLAVRLWGPLLNHQERLDLGGVP